MQQAIHIFLIYDSTHTNPDNIVHYIDIIHSNIQLSPTLESNNTVNFLDLSITRNPTHLSIGICLKPTTTDTTITFLSNHPLEHRMAAYRFLIWRMLSLPLDKEQQLGKWQQILHIAHIIIISTNLLTRLKRRLQSISQLEPHTLTQITQIGQHSLTHHHKSESYQHLQAHQH
jgi:hypothetical protein